MRSQTQTVATSALGSPGVPTRFTVADRSQGWVSITDEKGQD